MTHATPPTALIAEDEPLLAAGLKKALADAWPELRIVASVGNGLAAVEQTLATTPDVLFLDIRMPGLGGLEVAAEISEEWDQHADGRPYPALVFVTAYDQYAVEAFDVQAVDYLLKPLQQDRLAQTVGRVRQALAGRAAPSGSAPTPPGAAIEQTLDQLRQLLAAGKPAPTAPVLRHLPTSVGDVIRLVPLDEVVLLEAADEYVRVLTAMHEYLIRTPLRDLLPQLDRARFWQVHRGHVVRVDAIDTVTRDDTGKLWLRLRGRPERVAVSRLYAHLFKPM